MDLSIRVYSRPFVVKKTSLMMSFRPFVVERLCDLRVLRCKI
jgi:hypothetical protein